MVLFFISFHHVTQITLHFYFLDGSVFQPNSNSAANTVFVNALKSSSDEFSWPPVEWSVAAEASPPRSGSIDLSGSGGGGAGAAPVVAVGSIRPTGIVRDRSAAPPFVRAVRTRRDTGVGARRRVGDARSDEAEGDD